MADVIESSGARPFKLGPEVSESRTGTSSDVTYHGTRAEMEAQRNVERGFGASTIRLRKGDGEWILEVGYAFDVGEGGNGSPDQPVNQHDLDASMEQTSVYNSPRIHALIKVIVGTEALTTKVLGAVQRIVGMYHSGDFEPTGGSSTAMDIAEGRVGTEVDKIDTDATALAQKFFRMIAGRGVTDFMQFNEVYRRTITAARSYQVQAAYIGTGKIWTDVEVTAFEGIPNNEWFGLESGTQWLKTSPQVSAVSGGKTQITYSYIGLKQASALLYEAYGAATLLDA